MNAIMLAETPCWVCGYRNHWIWSASVRVNKKSIRSTGQGLYFQPPRCTECGHPHGGDQLPKRWWPDARTREKIDKARARWSA